jgi:hypothetical protein
MQNVSLEEPGNGATALGYVNHVQEQTVQTINAGGLTMNFILDERARELHWEGHRRTDLVRFGKFTGEVIYGHGKVGFLRRPTQSLEIYSYSSCKLSSNSKLQQNPGY